MADLEQTIQRKIEEIGNCLQRTEIDDLSLLGGLAGDTLFHLANYNLTKDKNQLELALEKINKIYSNFNLLKRNGLMLSNGIAGFAWLLQFVKNGNYIDLDAEEILLEFDSFFHLNMIIETTQGHYDYLHGGLGIASYYLQRHNIGNNKNYLTALVEELAKSAIRDNQEFKWLNREPKTRKLIINEYNLGLAHGIPSILIFLTKANQKNIAYALSLKMIKGIVKYLMRIKADPKINGSYYGYIDKGIDQTESRLAWCYGDLGVCFALYKAALVLKDHSLTQEIMTMLEHTAYRRDLDVNSVGDAELCHGAMGLSHIFKKLYLLSANSLFQETASYWLLVRLEMAKFEDGLAGFKTFKGHLKSWENEYGFLEGIAGIGLGLISSISDDNDQWDALLLLD